MEVSGEDGFLVGKGAENGSNSPEKVMQKVTHKNCGGLTEYYLIKLSYIYFKILPTGLIVNLSSIMEFLREDLATIEVLKGWIAVGE